MKNWFNSLSLKQKGLFFVAIPIALQAVVILSYNLIVERYDELNAGQHQSKEIIGRVNWLSTLLLASTAGALANSVTKDGEYAQLFIYSNDLIDKEFPLLASITKNNEAQSKNLSALSSNWSATRALLNQCQTAKTDDELKTTVASLEMKKHWREMFSERRSLLTPETQRTVITWGDFASARRILKTLLIAIVAFDFLLAIYLFYLFSSQIIQRVSVVTDNTRRLALGESLNAPIGGKDEVQILDQTFHTMAEQLNQAKAALEAGEKRLALILNNIPSGVFVVNERNDVEFANITAGALLGSSPNRLVGQPIYLFVTDQDKALINEILTDKITSTSLTVKTERDDKPDFYADLVATSIAFDDGMKKLISIEDVTARRQLEMMKKEFVLMVCHDLRNPLSSIMLFHKILERQMTEAAPENESDTKLLKHAQSATQNLMTLVNDMLESERFETSEELLLTTVSPLNEIIEQAIFICDGALQAKNIDIEYTPVNLEVQCDEVKIQRVIGNLIGNAAKFSPKKAKMKVTAEAQGAFAKIAVIDHGPGISKELQDRIFDKYMQVEVKNRRAGIGLGLFICKKFVESHGGQIGIESTVGEGSTFWFTVPLAPLETKA